MRSITEELKSRVEGLKRDAETLFVEHSKMRPHPPDDPYSNVIILHLATHYWEALSVEGRRVSSKLRQEYNRLAELVRVLLLSQSQHSIGTFTGSRLQVLEWIDQSNEHFIENGKKASARVAGNKGEIQRGNSEFKGVRTEWHCPLTAKTLWQIVR